MVSWVEYTEQISRKPEIWRTSYILSAKTLEDAERRAKFIMSLPGRNNFIIKDSKWVKRYGTDSNGNRYYRIIYQYEVEM